MTNILEKSNEALNFLNKKNRYKPLSKERERERETLKIITNFVTQAQRQPN